MKKILRCLTLIALFSAISFPAYGGTWLRPGVTYTFYGGQPGNRGEVIHASVKEVRDYVYEAKVDGQLMKGQWLGYCHPVYNPDEPQWSYFKPDGKEAQSWTQIDGNWYMFGGGTMLTGWRRTDGNYYYFDPVTGIMQTSGTAVRDGVTYEFQPDGLSKKIDGLLDAGVGGTDGWVEENGKRYYLRGGQRVTNEWLQDGDARYYAGEDGAMCTSSLVMDGFLYVFDGTGKLMTEGISTFSNGVKYVFDGTGRGVPVEMNAEERMYHSASTIWCEMTYEIYTRDVQMFYWEARDQEKILAGLNAQWGITNRDDCIATINRLFESGKAAQDKSSKAWDFSRAMMLCESGYWAGWWEFPEQMDMQISMAPTIQQSFSSWQEYQACYMDGFSNWSGGSGTTYEKRKSAYDRYVQNGSIYQIDWNIKIEKTW